MTDFGFTATSSKSGRQHGAPPVPVALIKDCFPVLDGMVLFPYPLGPFFFFFYQGLSSAFDFSVGKYFPKSKELPRVNFVKCAM